MATYLGLTTVNSENGYQVLAVGDSRAEVESHRPDPDGGIWNETKHVNYFVLSISAARRRFGRSAVMVMLEYYSDELYREDQD